MRRAWGGTVTLSHAPMSVVPPSIAAPASGLPPQASVEWLQRFLRGWHQRMEAVYRANPSALREERVTLDHGPLRGFVLDVMRDTSRAFVDAGLFLADHACLRKPCPAGYRYHLASFGPPSVRVVRAPPGLSDAAWAAARRLLEYACDRCLLYTLLLDPAAAGVPVGAAGAGVAEPAEEPAAQLGPGWHPVSLPAAVLDGCGLHLYRSPAAMLVERGAVLLTRAQEEVAVVPGAGKASAYTHMAFVEDAREVMEGWVAELVATLGAVHDGPMAPGVAGGGAALASRFNLLITNAWVVAEATYDAEARTLDVGVFRLTATRQATSRLAADAALAFLRHLHAALVATSPAGLFDGGLRLPADTPLYSRASTPHTDFVAPASLAEQRVEETSPAPRRRLVTRTLAQLAEESGPGPWPSDATRPPWRSGSVEARTLDAVRWRRDATDVPVPSEGLAADARFRVALAHATITAEHAYSSAAWIRDRHPLNQYGVRDSRLWDRLMRFRLPQAARNTQEARARWMLELAEPIDDDGGTARFSHVHVDPQSPGAEGLRAASGLGGAALRTPMPILVLHRVQTPLMATQPAAARGALVSMTNTIRLARVASRVLNVVVLLNDALVATGDDLDRVARRLAKREGATDDATSPGPGALRAFLDATPGLDEEMESDALVDARATALDLQWRALLNVRDRWQECVEATAPLPEELLKALGDVPGVPSGARPVVLRAQEEPAAD